MASRKQLTWTECGLASSCCRTFRACVGDFLRDGRRGIPGPKYRIKTICREAALLSSGAPVRVDG